jgi:large subunit ribosomal protein L30
VAKKLKVTLVLSLIGLSPKQEATVRALGLRHIRQTVEHDDTPTIRGMIDAVSFAVKVIDGRGAAAGEPSETHGGGRGAAAGEPSETHGGGRGAAAGEPSVSRKAQ